MREPFLIWMNRAKVYFNFVEDAGFVKEYNWMRTEMGILQHYKKQTL